MTRYKFAFAIRKYAATGGDTSDKRKESKELLGKAHDAAMGIAIGLPAGATTVGALGGAGTGYLLGKAFGKDAKQWGIGGALAGGGIGFGAAAPFSTLGLVGAHESSKIRKAIEKQEKEASYKSARISDEDYASYVDIMDHDGYRLGRDAFYMQDTAGELSDEDRKDWERTWDAAYADLKAKNQAILDEALEKRKKEPFFTRLKHDLADGRTFYDLKEKMQNYPDEMVLYDQWYRDRFPEKVKARNKSAAKRIEFSGRNMGDARRAFAKDKEGWKAFLMSGFDPDLAGKRHKIETVKRNIGRLFDRFDYVRAAKNPMNIPAQFNETLQDMRTESLLKGMGIPFVSGLGGAAVGAAGGHLLGRALNLKRPGLLGGLGGLLGAGAGLGISIPLTSKHREDMAFVNDALDDADMT